MFVAVGHGLERPIDAPFEFNGPAVAVYAANPAQGIVARFTHYGYVQIVPVPLPYGILGLQHLDALLFHRHPAREDHMHLDMEERTVLDNPEIMDIDPMVALANLSQLISNCQPLDQHLSGA